MSKDQRRAQTKKALLDALVICLKNQDFNDITTIRLVQTAGISRSSFYTHYKDKYEMIDSYQKELFHKLEYIFDKYEGKKEGAFLEIFEFLTREKLLSALFLPFVKSIKALSKKRDKTVTILRLLSYF